jgi:hypothetical protein
VYTFEPYIKTVMEKQSSSGDKQVNSADKATSDK